MNPLTSALSPTTLDEQPVPVSASPAAPNYRAAIDQWTGLLGSDHVRSERETLDRYSRTSLPTSTRPAAVIWPTTTEQVSHIVKIAASHRVPIYPISRGKNWGYGASCAVTDGQVIVDLGRMNRIIEVNATLAYAAIEPGVTQGQMYEHLRGNQIPLWLDVTGAGPDASIVGNTLERGFGHTPYGDHYAHSCGMEVVLGDGTIINTGFGAYENAKAAQVFPTGLGPSLDGLFTQSNMGIVTKLGFWLMPAPEKCVGFAFRVRHDSGIEPVIEKLRWLRLHEVVRSTVHVANDLRLLSARRQYPWDRTGGKTPLPDDIRQQLRREAGCGAWNVMGGLYGTGPMVAAARKVVRRAFRGVANVQFFDQRKLAWAGYAAKLLRPLPIGRRLGAAIESANSIYRLMRGEPTVDHLNGVFWRCKQPPHRESPDPTQVGLMWLSPVLPMTGDACREVLELVEPIFLAHHFEPLITMSAINTRALCCVMSICYDKTSSQESESAERCYETMSNTLLARGYLPYRTGIQSMSTVPRDDNAAMQTQQRLKKAFDPSEILAPGRYCTPKFRTGV